MAVLWHTEPARSDVQRLAALADGRTVTPPAGLCWHSRDWRRTWLSTTGRAACFPPMVKWPPGPQLDPTPAISAEERRGRRCCKHGKHAQLDASALTASAAALWIYNPVLLDDRLPMSTNWSGA
ncbi:MAG: hypothetical protein R2911_30780 [Caldilineaceae bacterium]